MTVFIVYVPGSLRAIKKIGTYCELQIVEQSNLFLC